MTDYYVPKSHSRRSALRQANCDHGVHLCANSSQSSRFKLNTITDLLHNTIMFWCILNTPGLRLHFATQSSLTVIYLKRTIFPKQAIKLIDSLILNFSAVTLLTKSRNVVCKTCRHPLWPSTTRSFNIGIPPTYVVILAGHSSGC